MPSPEHRRSRSPGKKLPVDRYLRAVVGRFLNDNQEQVIADQMWGDKSMEAVLHLTSPPSDTKGLIGYHVVYRAVDVVERTAQEGIIIANPRVWQEGYGVHNPHTTNRHYWIQGHEKHVRRQDIADGSVAADILLRGLMSSSNPFDIQGDPRSLSPLGQLREDVLDVYVSKPVQVQTVIPPRFFNFIGFNR